MARCVPAGAAAPSARSCPSPASLGGAQTQHPAPSQQGPGRLRTVQYDPHPRSRAQDSSTGLARLAVALPFPSPSSSLSLAAVVPAPLSIARLLLLSPDPCLPLVPSAWEWHHPSFSSPRSWPPSLSPALGPARTHSPCCGGRCLALEAVAWLAPGSSHGRCQVRGWRPEPPIRVAVTPQAAAPRFASTFCDRKPQPRVGWGAARGGGPRGRDGGRRGWRQRWDWGAEGHHPGWATGARPEGAGVTATALGHCTGCRGRPWITHQMQGGSWGDVQAWTPSWGVCSHSHVHPAPMSILAALSPTLLPWALLQPGRPRGSVCAQGVCAQECVWGSGFPWVPCVCACICVCACLWWGSCTVHGTGSCAPTWQCPDCRAGLCVRACA